MAQPAKNDLEVYKMLTPQLKIVVDYIVQKIWNENRELVRLIVYEAYKPKKYNRTGEFKEAWDTDVDANELTGKVEGEFYFEPSELTPGWPSTDPEDPQYGQHASAIDNFAMTDGLAEVIYEGLAGPAFGYGTQSGKWASKRDAWTKLVKKVGKTNMDKWVAQGMKRAGLKLRKW